MSLNPDRIRGPRNGEPDLYHGSNAEETPRPFEVLKKIDPRNQMEVGQYLGLLHATGVRNHLATPPETQEEVMARAKSEKYLTFVAKDGEAVVGTASLLLAEKTSRRGMSVRFEDTKVVELATHPNRQKEGVGRGIMEEVHEWWFEQRKQKKLESAVLIGPDDWQTAAHFFIDMGYRMRGINPNQLTQENYLTGESKTEAVLLFVYESHYRNKAPDPQRMITAFIALADLCFHEDPSLYDQMLSLRRTEGPFNLMEELSHYLEPDAVLDQKSSSSK